MPKYPIIPGLDPVETDPLDEDPDDDGGARTRALATRLLVFCCFFSSSRRFTSRKASSSWAPQATSSNAPFPRSKSRSARGRSKPSGVTVYDLMSLSCTAITLWRLMTDGHANFPFSRPETERGDATASDCFIRQLRVWYSIHRDGVLQPEDRHALILVSRQGQRLYYLRPHLVWLGNGADTSRVAPGPLLSLSPRSVAMTTNLEAVV